MGEVSRLAATERAFIGIDLTLSVAFGDSSPPGRAFGSVGFS